MTNLKLALPSMHIRSTVADVGTPRAPWPAARALLFTLIFLSVQTSHAGVSPCLPHSVLTATHPPRRCPASHITPKFGRPAARFVDTCPDMDTGPNDVSATQTTQPTTTYRNVSTYGAADSKERRPQPVRSYRSCAPDDLSHSIAQQRACSGAEEIIV